MLQLQNNAFWDNADVDGDGVDEPHQPPNSESANQGMSNQFCGQSLFQCALDAALAQISVATVLRTWIMASNHVGNVQYLLAPACIGFAARNLSEIRTSSDWAKLDVERQETLEILAWTMSLYPSSRCPDFREFVEATREAKGQLDERYADSLSRQQLQEATPLPNNYYTNDTKHQQNLLHHRKANDYVRERLSQQKLKITRIARFLKHADGLLKEQGRALLASRVFTSSFSLLVAR
eukprot:m.269688 g.269688  ORF g.269688 m.269688 type:complete len:237 (-) comp85838_c0_seq1:200-910(-)